MSVDQRTGFEERRLDLMRKHFDQSPKVRAYYRKRRMAVLAGLLGSFAVLALGLLLLKSFVIAYEGQAGYARIVGSVVVGQPPDTLAARLLGPDPISTELAAMLAPILPARAPVQASAPPLRGTDSVTPTRAEQSGQDTALAPVLPDENAPKPLDAAPPRAVLQLTD
jgi:hypothetical protein